MRHTFLCPYADCRQWITLGDALPNQSVSCPHCGRYVTVPPVAPRIGEPARVAIVVAVLVAVIVAVFLLTGTLWLPGCGAGRLPI
jgi:hypothetical protein